MASSFKSKRADRGYENCRSVSGTLVYAPTLHQAGGSRLEFVYSAGSSNASFQTAPQVLFVSHWKYNGSSFVFGKVERG